jgi:hypothetical protein
LLVNVYILCSFNHSSSKDGEDKAKKDGEDKAEDGEDKAKKDGEDKAKKDGGGTPTAGSSTVQPNADGETSRDGSSTVSLPFEFSFFNSIEL